MVDHPEDYLIVTDIVIRRARPHDFVNIMRLLEQGVQENEVAYPPINTMKIMAWIHSTKENGEIVVAELSGRIVGSIGMTVQTWKWADDKYIGNEWAYVLPNFRAHGTFEALMKAAEKFSDESGIRLVFGFSSGRKAEVKDRLMKMKGYVYCGGMFTRLAKTV